MAYASACVAGLGGGTVRLYHPADEPAYPDWFRDFPVRAPAPPGLAPVLELDDVILSNGRDWACLYDRDGRRIEASALPRYDASFSPEPWRAAPRLPSATAYPTIAEPVVYQSVFFSHWGHFLIESIARLARKLESPELARLPAIYTWRPARPPPAIEAFLAAAGVTSWPSEAFARIALRKCFVPAPTFAHEGYADPRHLAAPHRVARRLLRPQPRDERPVYLSRTRVSAPIAGRLPIRNEAELEARLAARRVRVVHMQELALPEQIAVMNAHRTFIGLWGSALHNILFSLDGQAVSTFVLLDAPRRPANFLLIDSIVGNAAHYLSVVRDDGEGGLTIDVEATLAYLREVGVV